MTDVHKTSLRLLFSPTDNGRAIAAWAHVAYCPICSEWLANFISAAPDAAAIPALDEESDLGKPWRVVRDQVGNLRSILINLPVALAQPSFSWERTRRPGSEEVLFSKVVRVDNFEIEIRGMLDDKGRQGHCRIVLEVISPGEYQRLSGISTYVVCGEYARGTEMDTQGIAQFDGVPCEAIKQLVIKISLDV
jgi:hypothetical protein